MIMRNEATYCDHCDKWIGYGDECYHANGLNFCSFDCWVQIGRAHV